MHTTVVTEQVGGWERGGWQVGEEIPRGLRKLCGEDTVLTVVMIS